MEATSIPSPAEAYPVGEYLRDELDARGWSGVDFAEIIGRPVQMVSELLNDRKELTPETAQAIGEATGTDPQTWLRLQATHQAWKVRRAAAARGGGPSDVERRGRLSSLVPVRELVQRGALPDGDLAAQERAVADLLGMSSINDDTPTFVLAARRRDDGEPLTPATRAWLALAMRTAAGLDTVPDEDPERLRRLAETMTQTVENPSGLRDLPERFAVVGVRLVHVLPLKGCKIDGATFRDGSGPVIALSGRIQRLDSVLFTLLHEVAHLLLGHLDDGPVVDVDLGHGHGQTVGRERDADDQASRWALPEKPRIAPPISRAKVVAEARRLGVSPAVVVGRLHVDGALPWSHLRQLAPSGRAVLGQW